MPKKGEVIKGIYKVISKLGKGSSGTVFLVETIPQGDKYALKVLDNAVLSEEMKIGLTLSKKCPFLVKFKEVFSDEEDEEEEEELFIVMEYCGGGDLSKRLQQKKPLTDAEIYCFIHDSGRAIKTLHDAGIIHRDIKPSNFFLVPNGRFKLGDYGTARTLSVLTMTRIGTDGYISPEILKGEKYTSKADIFSWGITLIEGIIGHNPYSASAEGVINLQLAALGTPVEAVLRHPHPAMQLARRMISPDPAARPSVEEVLASSFLAISHLEPVFASFVAEMERKDEDSKVRVDALLKENESLREKVEKLQKASSTSYQPKAPSAQVFFVPKPKPAAANFSAPRTVQILSQDVAVSSARDQELPIILLPATAPLHAEYTSVVSFGSPLCTIAVECDLVRPSVYVLNMKLNGHVKVGLALKSLFTSLNGENACAKEGTCFFFYNGYLSVRTKSKEISRFVLWNHTVSTDVALELDSSHDYCTPTTLRLFVSGKQVAHCIVNIPDGMSFVFASASSEGGAKVEVKSLHTVSSTRADRNLSCKVHDWNNF